jgi:hypothetical protein
MNEPDRREQLAVPDALGIPGRTVSPDLRQALYEIARDQADEEVESADQGIWAGLIRDTNSIVDEIPDVALSGDTEVRPGVLDPGELAEIRSSAGLIVTKDVEGQITVHNFPSQEELAAAWSALLVELAPNEAGAPGAAASESEENPT